MKTQIIKTLFARLPATLLLPVVLAWLAAQSALANGTAYYLDPNNGTTAGFGVGSGTYAQSGVVWNPNANGVGTLVVFPTTSSYYQMTFGSGSASPDLSGTFNVTLDTTRWNGMAVKSTGVNVTIQGNGNYYPSTACNLNVVSGSTLIINASRQGFDAGGTAALKGINYNNTAITLGDGTSANSSGTIDFPSPAGCNVGATSGKVFTQNMPSGTVNFQMADNPPSGAGTYISGYRLQAGTLNFASAGSTNQFYGFTSGVNFEIDASTIIDNTYGSSLGPLNWVGGGGINIAGSFTFTGTYPLNLGTAPVTLSSSTITVSASTLTIGGIISGSSSTLTKAGNGTLALTAANSYSGKTAISAGTLALSGSGSIAGTIEVDSGGTLDASALGTLTLASSQVLNFNGGTVTATSVDASSATISASAPSTSPSFTLSGSTFSDTTNTLTTTTLTYGGTASAVTITSLPGFVSYPQTFHIIKYTSESGSFNINTTPTLPLGYAGSISDNTGNSSIDLTLTAGPQPVAPITWTGTISGAPNGNWDILTTSNWLASGALYYYQNTSPVTFDDSATGQTNVNLTTTLLPASVTVNNTVATATANYSFTGSGKISGSAGLAKSGSGTLVVDNSTANDFSGGVIINNGTVQVGDNDANGSLGSGSVTNNGALVFNRTSSNTVTYAISGTGAVTQNGSGTNLFSGVNTYSGATTISSGTIRITTTNALGVSSPGGTVTISGGGTLDVGGITTANIGAGFGIKQFNISGAGAGGNGAIVNNGGMNQQNMFQNIALTGDATFGGDTRWDLRGGTPVIDLAGFTLTKTNANQISCVSPHVTDGNIIINQGILSFESTPIFDASAGTITVNPGGFLGQYKDTTGSFTRSIVLNGGGITNLSGSSTCFLDSTILLTANSVMGSSGGTETFNGIISDGGNHFGLTKYGTGTNLLATANTYSGNTVVNVGILGLTGSGSIVNSPKIIVAGGATFDVSGLSSSFTLGAGQTLSNSISTARFNGNASTGSGTVSLTYDGSANPSFTVTNGTLTLSSSTTFKVNNTGSALASGSYKIISKATAGNIGTVAGTAPSVTVGGGSVAAAQHASLSIVSGELFLNVTNHAPTIATIVTNSVATGTTWKIAITDLSSAAGWNDADSDPINLSSVGPTSNLGKSVTSDGTFIYYNAPVNAEDFFTYTITDGPSMANGTVYLEATNSNNQTYNISSTVVNGGGSVTLSGAGIPNRTNVIQRATTLTPPIPWTPVGTNVIDGTGHWQFTDPSPTDPAFYRSVTQP